MGDTYQHRHLFGWKISWGVLLTTSMLLSCVCVASSSNPLIPCKFSAAFANCSSRNLHFVPWDLHKNINSLDLSSNSFEEVDNHSFINYLSIRELNLRNNSIHTIKIGAFYSLKYLSILNLSSNKLRSVPTDALKIVEHSLEILNLAGNSLYTIPPRVFANLQNLKQLDLSGNNIYRVDHGAFLGLSKLLVFKIRHNALSSLPSDSFDDFPAAMTQVQLYDNRWFCDCNLRWLWLWLNGTSPDVWRFPGYTTSCHGPAFIRDEPLREVALDDLACKVSMKTSGSTRELASGANATMVCKYTSEPEAAAVWRKNSDPIDVTRNAHKYSVVSKTFEDSFGIRTFVSEMQIRNFHYDDIARYDCFVKNIRGAAFTEYRLTLVGVNFESVMQKQPASQPRETGVDTRSIVIAVAVVGSIIILIVIVILILCSVNRMQRKRKQKRDVIQENIKQHFMNSETGSNGDPASPDGKSRKPAKQAITMDNGRLDDTLDDHSKSNLTMDSTFKPPLDTGDEAEPMYPFDHPGSEPNGNTYVSFGSGLADPSEYMPHTTTAYSQAQQQQQQYPPPNHHQHPTARYEGSHAGSATPLLDRNTPSLYDSEEPLEDYAQYPVYDSVTNSLQHPTLPNTSYSNSDNGYEFLPNRQNSVASYASMGRNGGGSVIGDRSFQYPPSYNGSMPRTPGSTRSGFTYGGGGPRSVDGDSNSPDIYNNSPYQTSSRQQPPPPQQQQPPNYNNKYSDFRDGRYPGTTPPPHRMTPTTQKSVSVGNLGYAPVPTSSAPSAGPRKPPRIYQSREYMELTPHDSSSDYITSSEAQNYSQSFGITPGTPV